MFWERLKGTVKVDGLASLRYLERLVFGCFICLALVACESLPQVITKPTQAELFRALEPPSKGPVVEAAATLELTPAMHQFMDLYVPRGRAGAQRFRDLVYATMQPGLLGVRYREDAYLTASEVFEQRIANCLAFSNLIVALARDRGFKAYYQQVDVPPQWNQTNDFLVYYRHVNVLVKIPREGEMIVDLRLERYNDFYDRRVISDDAALALHHNNLAARALVENQHNLALVHVLRALEVDPKVALVWVNLGLVRRHLGQTELAITAYRQALRLNPREYSAMNNFAALLDGLGRTEEAHELKERARFHRKRNPYYRYVLAQKLFKEGDFAKVLEEMKKAIRREKREPKFYHLQGMSFWELGERDRAIDSLRRAQSLSSAASDKQFYIDEIHNLLNAEAES